MSMNRVRWALAIAICFAAFGAQADAVFEFVDVTDCKSAEFRKSEDAKGTFAGFFCKSGPKAWTAEEKKIISDAFARLRSLPLGPELLARVVAERGPIRLLRASNSVLTTAALADADVHIGSVTFYDKRFNPERIRRDHPFVWTVTHEVGHIFDCLPSNVKDTYS
ncbi:MAG: hypothetical protein AAB250_00165, partial [Bdellovibrionota bacterium]